MLQRENKSIEKKYKKCNKRRWHGGIIGVGYVEITEKLKSYRTLSREEKTFSGTNRARSKMSEERHTNVYVFPQAIQIPCLLTTFSVARG